MLTLSHLSCLSTTPAAQWIPPAPFWGHFLHPTTRTELEPERRTFSVENQGAVPISPPSHALPG